ncbi:MAG: hypothetical protein HFH37_01665 [Lachnospiraceae bacterium]|nr:hypothetical protein [Lachnospiraceae bacterium]
MISLGIIGYYLARIYEEIKGRPRSIVREAVDLDVQGKECPAEERDRGIE